MLESLVVEIVVAVLAVFGFYCFLQMVEEWIFTPRNIAVAVEIKTKRDAEELELLLSQARSASFQKGRSRILVLIPRSLLLEVCPENVSDLSGESYFCKLLEQYGAECVLVETGGENMP